MKLLVIGHSVLDHIKDASGFRFQPGGIFYTAMGLTAQKEESDEFFLCTLFEEEHLQLFHSAFAAFDLTYSKATARIPRVHLTIHAEAERCERFENLNEKIPIPDIELSGFDGVLINMISGFEMDDDDLAGLRKRFDGPIYFDVHSLTRGVGDSLVREFRKIEKFEKWAEHITFLQANENELLTLTEQTSEIDSARSLSNLGIARVLITKGETGAAMYGKYGDEVSRVFLPAAAAPVINKVGCGDIFGAYFFYCYIKSGNPYKALSRAITAAGKVTEYGSTADFLQLSNDLMMIT